VADSSSDRVAELKRKMQETAAKRMAEQAEKENASLEAAGIAPAAAPASAPAAETPIAETVAENAASSAAEAVAVVESAGAATPGDDAASGVQPVADAIATLEAEDAPAALVADVATAVEQIDAVAAEESVRVAETPVAETPVAEPPVVATPALNGTSASAGDPELPRELSPEEIEKREMSRRELLTYAWGGAMLLVGGAVGYGLFDFMYPRFRAGEFGGEFFISSAELPASDGAPASFSAGKFWLVQTEEGDPRALYMVCTHLGCLYKWEESNFRFECPCHGSKFSKDGYYIEGPAPRSLDVFATTLDGDTIIVDTGAKTIGGPAGDSPARAAA